MSFEADANIIVHQKQVEVAPGCYQYHKTHEWSGGIVARIGSLSLFELFGVRDYGIGDRLDFAGLDVRVLEGWGAPWFGILVVRHTGWRSHLMVARSRLGHALYPLTVLFWRTAWVCHLLDADEGSIPGWYQFRPFIWIKGLIQRSEAKS